MIREFMAGETTFRKEDIKKEISNRFHEDAIMYACHPYNQLVGVQEIISVFYEPLSNSFDGLKKVASIYISGDVRGEFWISSKGIYRGVFSKEWLDIPPTYEPVVLGYGEFHRIKQGKIMETKMLLDLPGLIRQTKSAAVMKPVGRKTPYRPKEESIHLVEGSSHALLSWVKKDSRNSDLRRMDWWSHGAELPLDHYWMRDELGLRLDRGEDVLEEIRKLNRTKTY